MHFKGDIVTIAVDGHFAQHAIGLLKQFCESTNELYAEEMRKAHRKQLEQERARLAHEVAQEEARLAILNKLQI
jgi:hypothetical protein